jgi:replicative DNA helicase
LEHWRRYHEPIGGLLKSEVLEYIETHRKEGTKRIAYDKKELIALLQLITSGNQLVPAESMEDKVRRYLERKYIKNALEEVIEAQEAGNLTPKKFAEVCRKVGDWSSKKRLETIRLVTKESLEDRIVRRTRETNQSRPFLLIDGLDSKTKLVGRGDLGLLIAPAKAGKSVGLAHISTAYARQRLNVMHVSLEDPKDEVEDRFDASWTGIPITELNKLPNKLRNRFKRFARSLDHRIELIDGTDEALGIADIEEIYLRRRDQGWIADAVIIDYDDYIKSVRKYEKKMDRFDEIYVDFRRFLARYDLIGWTAAQSKRVKEGTSVIGMNAVADDIGKIRKCTMCIGVGYGKTGPDARYLYVNAHKRGRMNFGTEIITNLESGIFYDRERTMANLNGSQNGHKRSTEI